MGKPTYEKKLFEHDASYSKKTKRKDTFATIYMSMLMSPAWKALTANQQRLYLYCKAQFYGEHPKPKTEEHPHGHENYFTMNRAKWMKLYKLYNDNNRSGFSRDINALIEKGFISCVECGATTRTKSIYSFSSMWTKYDTEDFNVPFKYMTSSLVRSKRKNKMRMVT